MAEDTTQPVATEAKDAASPAPDAGKGALDNDLTSLLSEYAAKTTKPAEAAAPAAAQPKPDAPSQGNDLPSKVDQLKLLKAAELIESEAKERVTRERDQAVGRTVKAIRGELPDDALHNAAARGWLEEKAASNPALVAAFNDRQNNPQQWAKIEAQLTREFAAVSKRPDSNLTEDREAVSAAVRGTATTPPPAKELNIMQVSDSEAKNHVREKYGYSPSY